MEKIYAITDSTEMSITVIITKLLICAFPGVSDITLYVLNVNLVLKMTPKLP
jgi:hypothetical protein